MNDSGDAFTRASRARRVLAVGLRAASVTLAVLVTAAVATPPALASGPYSSAIGTGSTYAALAFQQWVGDGTTQGLRVGYTPTNSPQGLQSYEVGTFPFAGTEAEFSSLLGVPDATIKGGFEYTPDVAGAIAVMYNTQDQAGRAITYLHLAQRTVARIFMGLITNWNDPEITADNLGLVLPSHAITVIYRTGQSGTTALFYDFVAHADPQDFVPWANATNQHTTTRIIDLDGGGRRWAPLTEGETGSDQQAAAVASQPWSISYDEFAYPKTAGAQVAWIQNGAGKWTQPYALNITAGLAAATLRPDLSQDLTGVYTSANPVSYPISAYSYIVTACATNPQFPTCQGTYGDAGVANTLGTWMSYIACGGQVAMAEIGYAPLPTGLSQDMANSVARITGQPALTLTAANCANPQFAGNLGVGAAGPPDPYLAIHGGLGGGGTGGSTPGAAAPTGGTSGGTATTTTVATSAKPSSHATPGKSGGSSNSAVGTTASASGTGVGGVPVTVGTGGAGLVSSGAAAAVGRVGSVSGDTGISRSPAPIAYGRPIPGGVPALPLVVFLVIFAAPALWIGENRRGIGRLRGWTTHRPRRSTTKLEER